MTANDSKYYMGYLNKLVDKYNNNYHRSIDKKPIDADYVALYEKIEINLKIPKFGVRDRIIISKYKNIFSKGYNKNCSREIFVIDSVLKTNPWLYRNKDSNKENIIKSFHEKELLFSKL